MITLLLNGSPYTGFISASVTRALRTLANDFTFTASAVDAYPAPRRGDAVQVQVDGELVLTGHIEELKGVYREGTHAVTYTGRDRTGDLIDSSLDVLPDLRASDSLTLSALIQTVLQHLGLDIPVIDTVRPAPFNRAEDIITPQPGESAIEFVLTYARKRQVLLTSDELGRIVITQAAPVRSGARLQSRRGDSTNNILGQDWGLSDSARFNRYVRRGQLDPRTLNYAGESSTETVANQSGARVDAGVRRGRQQVVIESASYSAAQLADRAAWARQLAEAQATSFSCTSKGHRNSAGDLWLPNTLVQIDSEPADISREMLLDVATFSQGEDAPTISALEFVEKDVYTIDSARLAQRPVGDQNDAFKPMG